MMINKEHLDKGGEEIAAWKNQQAENWGHKNRRIQLGKSSVTISKG
jgi:hypothetical protein